VFEDIESVVKLEKISKRSYESTHPIILERLNNLKKFNYVIYGHQYLFNPKEPVFTILLTLHDTNLDYIIQSLNSIKMQTYSNTELIVIDNGSTGEVSTYVDNFFLSNSQVKLLRVESNQYNPQAGDNNPLVDLWNAGLFASVGDFIFFQSYDDLLSSNYVERMVKLFRENPKCVSASPLVSSIDSNGNVNVEFSRSLELNNLRKRYESGISLSQQKMRNINLISSPGGLLAQKSDMVISSGGFDSMNDLTQLFRFAIQGDVGFDPQAMLFWRHHDLQTNVHQSQGGVSYYKEFLSMPCRYNLYNFHSEVAGTEFANEFKVYLYRETSEMCISNISLTLYRYGHKSGLLALYSLIKEAPFRIIIKATLVWIMVSIRIVLRRNHLIRRVFTAYRRFILKH
jgi:glycosyltransferase involved in cell wall biosynthesis